MDLLITFLSLISYPPDQPKNVLLCCVVLCCVVLCCVVLCCVVLCCCVVVLCCVVLCRVVSKGVGIVTWFV